MVEATLKGPSLCFHRASGQFYVCLSGKTHYLGRKRKEAEARYGPLVAEWLANGRRAPVGEDERTHLTVMHVAAEHLQWAKGRYQKDGEATGELQRVKYAIGSLNEVCARMPAKEFSPLKLQAVIRHMLRAPVKENPMAKKKRENEGKPAPEPRALARSEINARIRRIKRCFKWAASQELVPASVYHGIQTVAELRRGESGVREAPKVGPVDEATFKATLPYMAPLVRVACELMWYTAARPHEVVILRPCDVDRSDPEVWVYTPKRSKIDHLLEDGERREIFLGPEAQRALAPLLERTLPTTHVFDPRAAMAEFYRKARAERVTELWPSHVLHQARRAAARKRRVLGHHYDVASLTQGIARAIKRANRARKKDGLDELPHWTAGQVRHAAADRIGESASGEASSLMLGHASQETTRRFYRTRNRRLAKETAAELG